jgi:hypothetical protein
MFTEARKIHLLEEVLKTTNENTLVEIEKVLKVSKKKVVKTKKPSIYDFVGILTKKEANGMRKAIEETCEIINPDDWK